MDANEFVIRPITRNDFDWLFYVSTQSGVGFTSLPSNKEYLAHRIESVEKSFQKAIPEKERIFLFVLEHIPTQQQIGLCGIDLDVGHKDAFYNYKISTISQTCKSLEIYLEHKVLHLVNDFQHAVELISFWMDPKYRGLHLGKFLSLSRFLYIAQHRQSFGKKIIAEIRGESDFAGQSPFWDAIGRVFFNMELKRADALTMSNGKQFIAELMPREPIYIDLLPESAQTVIGKEHATATPARYLLESQGFEYNEYIDIFDAGPLLDAEIDKVVTVANSQVAIIKKLAKANDSAKAIVFNAQDEVRIALTDVSINEQEITIDENVAKNLSVEIGDPVRYCLIGT